MSELICRRCSSCCVLRFNNKTKACRYLIKHGTKSSCRIYSNQKRIGMLIGEIDGKRFYCANREDYPVNYPGCPYNQECWEELDAR